jgi:ribulose-phosphate 3-epimerase
MLRKIEAVRTMMGDRHVQVDGGIDEHTAGEAVHAGADVLVAGSFIYGSASYAGAIGALKSAEMSA